MDFKFNFEPRHGYPGRPLPKCRQLLRMLLRVDSSGPDSDLREPGPTLRLLSVVTAWLSKPD
eukprot:705028-Rhodomonas_salina.1